MEAVLRRSVGKQTKLEFHGLVWDEAQHKAQYVGHDIFSRQKSLPC